MAVGGPGCDNPPKLATIEYDCMSGHDIRGPADTLNTDNLYRNARKRFNDGYTLLAFQEDELALSPLSFSTATELSNYVMTHWEQAFWLGQKTADFYVLGIQDCINRANFYEGTAPYSLAADAAGITKAPNGGTLGMRGASAIIFAKKINDVLNTGSRQVGYNRTAVHEMGHALANLQDVLKRPDLHNGQLDANCVMNEMVYYDDGTLANGRTKFCDKCREAINNITWQ
jgi:hypothetical protein